MTNGGQTVDQWLTNRTCIKGLGLGDLRRSLPAPRGPGFWEEGDAHDCCSHHTSARSVPLPDVLGKAASTHLDQNLYRFRSTNLEQVVRAALRLKHEELSLPAVLEQAEDWLCRLRAMAEEVTPPCPSPHHCLWVRFGGVVALGVEKLQQGAVGESRWFGSVMLF